MSNAPAKPRVEKTIHDGNLAWIKHPEQRRNGIYTRAHRVLSPFLPTVLRHTGAIGDRQSLNAEAERLRLFAAASLHVPRILKVAKEYIVLSDTGRQLLHCLRTCPDTDKQRRLMRQAMMALATVHSAGFAHGRPHLKDMTLHEDGHIYFLDLEENPVGRMGIHDAQARDVWLLLASCVEFFEEPLQGLCELLDIYQSSVGIDKMVGLRALGQALRPYCRLVDLLQAVAIRVSKDVLDACWAAKALQKL